MRRSRPRARRRRRRSRRSRGCPKAKHDGDSAGRRQAECGPNMALLASISHTLTTQIVSHGNNNGGGSRRETGRRKSESNYVYASEWKIPSTTTLHRTLEL